MTSYPKSLSKLILLLMFTLCVYRSNAQMFSGRVTESVEKYMVKELQTPGRVVLQITGRELL